jgi:hypothetical protein
MDNNARAAVDDAFERLFEAVETVESITPLETLSSDEESQVQPIDIEDSASDNEADDEEESFNTDIMVRNFERYRALARDRRRATIRFSRTGLHRRLVAGRILFEEEERRRGNLEERLFEADTAIAIRMSMSTYKPHTKTVAKEDVDKLCPVIKARHQKEKCTVCQEHVKRDEDIRILPCKHYMHDECTVGWFTTGNAVCPVCRDKSFEEVKKPIKKRKRISI